MIKYRLESDSIGTLEVPADAYYGVQSLRGKNNFHITGYKVSDTFITVSYTHLTLPTKLEV